MIKQKRRYKTKIEAFLGEISPEGRDEWEAFVATRRTSLEIQRFWQDRGFKISPRACWSWMKVHDTEGEYTKVVTSILDKYKGMSTPVAAMDASVKILVVAVSHKYAQAEALCFDDQSTAALVNAVKELVKAAALLNGAQVKRDRTEDVLSGAYELARKVTTAVKNHASGAWVEEVLNGELKQLEDETKAEFLGEG